MRVAALGLKQGEAQERPRIDMYTFTTHPTPTPASSSRHETPSSVPCLNSSSPQFKPNRPTHLLHCGFVDDDTFVRTKLGRVIGMDGVEQDRAIFGQQCPRCRVTIPPKLGGVGRPRLWCSQMCRRAAYEERRAAKSGAIAVELRDRPAEPARVVEIEKVRVEVREVHHEATMTECRQVVNNDPDAIAGAVQTLMLGLAQGECTGSEWLPAVDAARELARVLAHPGTELPERCEPNYSAWSTT